MAIEARHRDVPGSVLLISGLRKVALYSPIVAVVGYVMCILLIGASTTAALVVGGISLVIAAIIAFSGIVEILDGAAILFPLGELALQHLLTRKRNSAAPAQSAATPPGSIGETSKRVRALEPEQSTTRHAQRGQGKPLEVLLSDPEIARAAREIRRLYGTDVGASFLNTKANEAGLGDLDLTGEDFPDDFWK